MKNKQQGVQTKQISSRIKSFYRPVEKIETQKLSVYKSTQNSQMP